jgi:hypothetical protein
MTKHVDREQLRRDPLALAVRDYLKAARNE